MATKEEKAAAKKAKEDAKAAAATNANAGTGKKGFIPPPSVDEAITQLAPEVLDGKLVEEETVMGLAQHYKIDPDDVQKQMKAALEAVTKARAAADASAAASKKADQAKRAAQDAEAAAAAAAGKVLVNVPKAFRLRDDATGVVTHYRPGMQRMPEAHANHWYSKQCGVKAPTDE